MEHVVGYVGQRMPDNSGRCLLTDWDGHVIGTCRLTSSWRTPRSFVSSRMYQVRAVVEGREFTGRCGGEGLAVRLRPVRGRA